MENLWSHLEALKNIYETCETNWDSQERVWWRELRRLLRKCKKKLDIYGKTRRMSLRQLQKTVDKYSRRAQGYKEILVL